MSTCPLCHQPINDVRLGVQMTPLKAAIVDRIKTAGDIGVSTMEIVNDIYCKRSPIKPVTVKAHVNQINDLLAATDWRICSDRRRWFLQKGKNWT
jgi:hypothetical protein